MKNIALIFLMLFLTKVNSQVTLETFYETSDSQINIYIVSQGYDNAHMSEFNSFVNGLLNKLWSTVPFNEFQSNFRIILVRDIATTNGFPRAFNQFDPPTLCSGGSVSGAEDYDTFKTRMDNLITNYIPDYDDKSYLIAVFNNDYYTGGGGEYVFATENCYGSYMYNVIIHEFGHSFGLLGDEYGPTTASVDPNDFPLFHNRNITNLSTPEDIPWKYLIAPSTPIPTCSYGSSCFYTVTGLYESANYTNIGWYRPKNNCKMRTVTQSFCPTCRDLLRETIIKHLCPTNSTISEDFISRHQYLMHWRKASESLSSTSTIGNKISVTFLSQNEILLTPGFEAVNGSDFAAKVGDCSSIDLQNEYKIQHKKFRTIEQAPENTISDLQTEIYPNPFSGNTLFFKTTTNSSKQILIYDMLGKPIINTTTENNFINVTNLASGVYLVKIIEAEKTATKKLIVE